MSRAHTLTRTTVTVTTAEAAFVAGLPLRQVQKAIDGGPIRPTRARGRRVLDEADLVYLVAMKALASRLKAEARGAFYEAVKRSGVAAPASATFGQDLKAYYATVKQRLTRLQQLRELIETPTGHAPVIKGTRIEAHRIAALLDGGASVERVLADHPSLDQAQVLAAADYAAAQPKPGRHYPTKSVRQAFDEAGLDDLADIIEARDRQRRQAR